VTNSNESSEAPAVQVHRGDGKTDDRPKPKPVPPKGRSAKDRLKGLLGPDDSGFGGNPTVSVSDFEKLEQRVLDNSSAAAQGVRLLHQQIDDLKAEVGFLRDSVVLQELMTDGLQDQTRRLRRDVLLLVGVVGIIAGIVIINLF
jgi:hypothetical protein